MNRTDQQLLAGTRSSDMGAFKVLFERYQPPLFRSLLYRIHDEDLSHDLVQETFVRLWQRRTSLNPDLPLFPYLLRISENLLKDHYKHERVVRRHREELGRATESPAETAQEQIVQGRELEEEIRAIVREELSERCRTVFLLSRMEGKDNREIAGMLGISVKTVENQITRALSVLRRRLARYFRESSGG